MGVVVSLDEKVQEPSISSLVGLVASDMERVNATILQRTGSDVAIDSGSREPPDLVRRQAAAPDADARDSRPRAATRAKAT